MKIMVEMIGECVNVRMLDLRKALFRSTSLYFLAYDFGVKDRKGCESRGAQWRTIQTLCVDIWFWLSKHDRSVSYVIVPLRFTPLSILLTF